MKKMKSFFFPTPTSLPPTHASITLELIIIMILFYLHLPHKIIEFFTNRAVFSICFRWSDGIVIMADFS